MIKVLLSLSLAGFFATAVAGEVKDPCELFAARAQNNVESLLEDIKKWQSPSDTTKEFCQTVKNDLMNLRNARTAIKICRSGDQLDRDQKELDKLENFTTNMLQKLGCGSF
jgi:hypothetical protein